MDEIINDFHDLDQIPVFQTQIDPEMMNTADRLDVLQMNIGRVCNLACKHCHVCAGPNRTEVMSREVMADCIQFAREQQVQTIDITGGAPVMNPDFEWLVTEACKVCSHVIVRTNLTVLLNPEYEHLIEFYARQNNNCYLYLPESFEWLILKSGVIKNAYLSAILQNTWDYVDSSMYMSWERYFTALLVELTNNTYLQYSKNDLNDVYIKGSIKDNIVKQIKILSDILQSEETK